MATFWQRYRLVLILVIVVIIGQAFSYLISPASWMGFVNALRRILSMIAFWGPIVLVIASLFVWAVMRLLGFKSLDAIREESVAQNNPAPAIIFVGTLIASVLFLMLVIKP